eukprot:CAMPEP_0184869938 /NCGR_PEP_ID=MMETSP0580-20130426/35881_1 /TAXON_ID=1118495 /ORGANISM="Dactyliosolen fragilissimus" /LENGTH=166 /DNA_ID=CAMNT_0027371769 /DNA_START=115 /DNA_END=615 /DNA_ORIENTATION=-
MAMIVFTHHLNKIYRNRGLRAVSVDPGAVNSDIWRHMTFPEPILKYIVRPIFRLIYLNNQQGSTTSIAAAVGRLPSHAVYLQPYWQPRSSSSVFNSKSSFAPSFQTWYALPFPLFEMLGPYVGFAITDPRLPRNTDDASLALWKASEELVYSNNRNDYDDTIRGNI